jgi:aminomethyltransferase
MPGRNRHPLFPNVRRSPYFARTEAAGAVSYMAYNHMYMPMSYGRAPGVDYAALATGAVIWDVGGERQVELHGPDALALADLLVTRDLSASEPGRCRYVLVCDQDGVVLCDPVAFHVAEDRIWLSHGNADLLLWAKAIAYGTTLDVQVREADVAPIQVQGPLSRDVLRPLVGALVDELSYYRLARTEIAGLPVVLSRTGWSGELGFEVLPLASATAVRVWDAIVAAGEPSGLLVTGPNVQRAVECGIRDTTWATGMGITGLELDEGRLVDLGKRRFVGRDALLAERERGPSRRSVGLRGIDPADPQCPPLDREWEVSQDGRRVGATRWAAHSPRLDRTIALALVERSVGELGARLDLHRSDVAEAVEVVPLPFLAPGPGART